MRIWWRILNKIMYIINQVENTTFFISHNMTRVFYVYNLYRVRPTLNSMFFYMSGLDLISQFFGSITLSIFPVVDSFHLLGLCWLMLLVTQESFSIPILILVCVNTSSFVVLVYLSWLRLPHIHIPSFALHASSESDTTIK